MNYFKSFLTMSIALVYCLSQSVGIVNAITDEQRSLFNRNIHYYNLSECNLETESSSEADSELQELINKLAAENKGLTAISVKSLDGKTVASANGTDQMATRSTYKIYVAYAILKAVADKKLTWGAVSTDFNKMIIESDNPAAERLRTMSEVGGPNGITRLLRDEVKLSSKTVMGTASYTNQAGTNSKSSSDDFVKFLELLEKRELPGLDKARDDGLYEKLLDAMKSQSARTNGIKQGVGSGTTVADKPGWGGAPGAATNDVGIVYGKNKYAIAILTDYGDERWDYVAKVAKQVHEVMEKSGSSSGSPPSVSGSNPSGGDDSGGEGLVGGTNAEKAYNYFVGKGMKGNGAAGIVGNLMQESGGGTEDLNTRADNGTHYGIAQWDKIDRFPKLVEFARDSGRKSTDLDAQLDFIMEELGADSYTEVLEKLKKAKSPKDAAHTFLVEFERSGEKPGSDGYEKRMKFAEQLKNKYGEGKGGSNQVDSTNTCVCAANESAVSGSGPVGKADGTIEGFIDAYGKAAFDIGKKYGIPYEAILAQGGIESGWGKSDLTVDGNNFFGIKAGEGWSGKTLEFQTKEENPPRTVTAQFRAYDSPEDGFTGYASFIHHNSRYKEALKHPKDPAKYIEEIRKAGYATDNSYVDKNVTTQQKIISYIKSKDLFPPSSEVKHENLVPPPENQAGGAGGGSSADCSDAGADGGSIVEVAEREYEKNKGITEYGGTIKEYTDGRMEPWCADFVSWVYREAGSPFTDGIGEKGWQHPGVLNLKSWMEQNHTFFKPGEQDPQPGDVAFYIGALTPDGGSSQHVNIVISVDGDTMTTIGGNESNQILKRKSKIKLGEQSLAGFGRLKK